MPYVTNKRVRIHYEVEGKGPPLVLVHGQCGNLQAWYDYGYVESLAKKFDLVLVDVRGHGLSDKPHDSMAYTMKLIVSDIVAVLDSLRISKARFLGFSLGGCIVFGIAKYAPERIHSLIIGGAHPYALRAEELAGYDSEIQLWKKGTRAVVAAIEKRRRTKLTPKMKAMLMSNDPKAIAALMSGEDYTLSLEDVLPTMKMPCLVYCGERDGNYSGAKKCVKRMPNATFVSLPRLNHLETFCQVDIVLPHITKFLEGVKRTRRSRP